jgi:hypothetical protein
MANNQTRTGYDDGSNTLRAQINAEPETSVPHADGLRCVGLYGICDSDSVDD